MPIVIFLIGIARRRHTLKPHAPMDMFLTGLCLNNRTAHPP